MNTRVQQFIEMNKNAATTAAVLETGRIANSQAAKMIGSKLPFMVRPYADTPFGKLVIANAAMLAVQQFRPDNKSLLRIANGMQVAAYQEVLSELDIEGFLDDLLNDSKIAKALSKDKSASE